MRTLAEVLTEHQVEPDSELGRALLERENEVADFLRTMGMTHGAFPEFVAAVLVESTLGTPVSDEEKALITQNYQAKVAWFQEQIRRQQEGN